MPKKLLQNKVAGSKLALPVVSVYAVVVWILYGLVTEQWWLQFGGFAVTSYLMLELNNLNALIRIYSRMVSCAFLMLFCAACFLMPSIRGAIMQTCVVAAWLVLFQSYQDKTATGLTYYAFLFLSLASIAYVHVLFFVPFIWLLMATNFLSLSWRTWGASLLGLLTPYWFGGAWLVYQNDFMPLITHFAQLVEFQQPFNFSGVTSEEMAVFALLVICTVTGIIHYIRKSFQDKIRIRMIFGFFIWTGLLAFAFLLLQPQHSDMLLRVIIISTAPIIAHFLALTSTRLTNIAFCVLVSLTVAITIYQLCTTSSLF